MGIIESTKNNKFYDVNVFSFYRELLAKIVFHVKFHVCSGVSRKVIVIDSISAALSCQVLPPSGGGARAHFPNSGW